MTTEQRRRDRPRPRTNPRDALRRPSERLLTAAVGLGFLIGLVVTLFRDALLPEQFNRDANRIFNIASGRTPEFTDGSYTPVGLAYRFLGLGSLPDLAALVGYLLACVVIVAAIVRSGRRSATPIVALYVVAAFVLSGVYLGQYSKDVFVLVPVALLVLLPRRIWWEAIAFGAMLAYAFLFRDYWAIIAAAYLAYRVLSLRQARLRYLLLGGGLAAVGVGLVFHVALGVDPNHYRTAVQGHLDANTLIVPLEPFAQPAGGAVDVFLNYWLIYAPVLLPFTATVAYTVVLAAIAFARVLPVAFASSVVRWPGAATLDGALVRRSLSLLLAFAVVQAVFEPDYGSALRHFTPLMPLAIVLMQSMRSGEPRRGRATPWSWSGAAAVGRRADPA